MSNDNTDPTNTDPPTVEYDKTLWVVVKDLKNFQFYVRDYNALSVSVIDLKTVAYVILLFPSLLFLILSKYTLIAGGNS